MDDGSDRGNRGTESRHGPAIRISGLCLSFETGLLFDDLRLDLPGGQITALLGASGVGKTSLLRILAGLAQPLRGAVETSDDLPLTGRVAYMGQQDLLMPWLSALSNVTLGARLRGAPADAARARELLRQVGLAGSEAMRPGVLSGGMRQRVALARTLYEDRPVVLMDEPFSALDSLTRARVQTLAARLLHGRTVLLITHDPLEACRLAQRVLVMRGFPATLSEPLVLGAATPRNVDDPGVLAAQGALMRTLLDGEA